MTDIATATRGTVATIRRHRPRVLHWAPALTLVVMLGPVLAGFAGTLAPALGYLPALGGTSVGLEPFRDLLAWPGFWPAARLSVTTGLLATGISLLIVALVCASWQGTRAFDAMERVLSPLLSIPHAAAAFGIAFLIAPSGWVARAFSPWLTGWARPPDLLIAQDPAGFALVAGLVAKEVPFLLLMTIAALGQTQPTQSRVVAQALGYGRASAWLKTVFPRVYPQIRLPVYAVLAYSMSVVDVAMILGPTTPATLSVQIVQWTNDPDLALRFRAAAGAVVQFGLVVGALGFWRLGEIVAKRLGEWWICRGGRGRADGPLRVVGLGAAGIAAGAVTFGLAGLAVWSVAGFWSFPDLLPDGFTWRTWSRHGDGLWAPAVETMAIAGAATLISLLLVLASLEAEQRYGIKPSTRSLWLLYTPLLMPQVAFLTGLQGLALELGVEGGRVAVILAHTVFVLPYVFLSLADPFRAWDQRYRVVANALGAGPDRVLWTVRLPMLLRPALIAAAVGFAVSVGQYLPTLLIGGGRVQTLTTEAVALASGGDRRVIGLYALGQTVAAFVAFAAALAIPRLLWRNRRALRHG
jgi:putative thiamine transport system permease protein